MAEIYNMAEDSFLFESFLIKHLSKNKKRDIFYLDMGCGSGILSEAASNFIDKNNILAVDINEEAVKLLRSKGFKSIKSDLFKNVKGKFDLITFNAPYLPRDKLEPKDSRISTTGGKRGDEISVRFLKAAKKYLKEDGRIFLLISSLTPTDKINKFNPRVVESKKLFFEELIILEFTL